MDTNIVKTVYNLMQERAEEIGKAVAERDKLEEKIKSGRYSSQTLNAEIYPKLDALRQEIRSSSDNAIREAKNLIEQYRQDADALNDLDPAQLTDDIKLLQAGIPLLPRDIQAILKRNSSNRTMTQLALRYAEEHKIDTHGTFYIGGQQEKETANNLETLLTYCAKYLDQPDAGKMIDKFFNVNGD